MAVAARAILFSYLLAKASSERPPSNSCPAPGVSTNSGIDGCDGNDPEQQEAEAMRQQLLQKRATVTTDLVASSSGSASEEDNLNSTSQYDSCDTYMKEDGCAWTEIWNCPGQHTPNKKGHAHSDGTLGYKCCCWKQLWQKLPTPAPTPAPPPPPPGSYWTTGHHKNMTVYHQTSPEVCESIMQSNFRIGKGGLCGKAVYFALTPEATRTKAITKNSHGGCMIQAVVDVGRHGRFYWRGYPQWKDHQKEQFCGGWNQMKASKLHHMGYDSIIMRQGDGDEVIIFEPERILEKKVVHFNCKWMCTGECQKHWPPHCHKNYNSYRRRYSYNKNNMIAPVDEVVPQDAAMNADVDAADAPSI
eukprot:TRINITY_DN111823_c0_g1_i1.p1 TRINITY_DN111823_c0_g1~~TRINITY_DN111823_c0_g1_i1.p1  ORF type:complete len:359 (+),score=66.39 TRINITY_DN111823_c0_g1_i1:115-1191(+)